MKWIFYGKIVAAILTLVLIFLVAKYLIEAIKDDKNGKPPKKCDLD